MARAKAEIMKRASNLGTQAFAETPVGHKTTFVIRLKGGKYSSINKPRDECVLDNVDQQLASSNVFTRLFHGSMVIGLQYKYTTKKDKTEVQNRNKTVQYRLRREEAP